MFLRQSTIQTIRFGPFLDSTDGVTAETGLTITQADRQISKDGAAFAQSGETGNSTHDTDGWYYDDLTAADTGTVGELYLQVAVSGALPVWVRYWVIEEAIYDAIYGASATGLLPANVTQINGTAQRASDLEEIAQYLIANAATLTSVIADDSIMAKLLAVGGTISTYDEGTDSQEAIRNAIVAASPQTHIADSSVDTTGTVDSGTYADTHTVNTTYWQLSPAGAAVGGFGLNFELVFTAGTGLDRSPEAVNITGYVASNPTRPTEVWAYNYITAGWDQLSNSETNMQNAASNQNYQYTNVNENHINTSNGEMKMRFTMTSTTTADDLYIDYVGFGSVAIEAAGLTADAIQQAVWSRTDDSHDENTLGYNLSKVHIAHGDIVSASDAKTFVIDYNIPNDDAFVGMTITLEDKTNDLYESRRITSTTAASNTVVVDSDFSFTPVAADDYYIMNGAYGKVDTTHVSGTSQTANDNGADISTMTSGIIEGAAQTGTLSTTQATTNLSGYADDQLIGRHITVLSGNAEGEQTDITDYASASGLLTFTALTVAMANGDTFKIT